MRLHILPLFFLIAGAFNLSFSMYPVVCHGGSGMSIRYDGTRGKLILTARPAPQGANFATPAPGKCAWMDRPMTRPVETTRGGVLIFEVQVPRDSVEISMYSGRVQVNFRDELARQVWQGVQGRRVFRFQAVRKGEGLYTVAGDRPYVTAEPAPPPPGRRDIPRAEPAPRRSPVPSTTSVEITLERINVHNDGDNVSPGDWKVIMMAFKGNRAFVTTNRPEHNSLRIGTVQWPSRGTKNVNSGKSYSVGLSYYLHNVRADEWISLTLLAVDCDSNGIFAIRKLSDLFPLAVLERQVRFITRTQRCSGEEVYEASGAHDRTSKTIVLPPQDWRSGRTFRYRISGDGLDFTAYIRVRVLR